MKKRQKSFDHHRAQRAVLGPSWRYQIASSLSPGTVLPNDPWLVDCRDYFYAKHGGPECEARAQGLYPLVAAAEALNFDSDKTAILKMMVVADMTEPEIVEQLKIAPAVLTTWEMLFFDVRGLRDATTWFATNVVEQERRQGNPTLASRLKIAHCAGAAAVRVILDADDDVPSDVADQLFAQKLKLQLKLDEAVDMPLETEKHAVQVMNAFAEMQVDLRRIDLESQKVVERCQQAARNFELAKLRKELAIKRADHKAAEALRKAAKCVPLEDRIATSSLAKLAWNGGAESQLVSHEISVPYVAKNLTRTSHEDRADQDAAMQGENLEVESPDSRLAASA